MNFWRLPSIQALALSLGLSSPIVTTQVEAQSTESSNYVNQILWWLCIPEFQDVTKFREEYIAQSWDSVSKIAKERSIVFSDFIAYFEEFNPGVDPSKIRAGTTYTILSEDISAEILDRNRVSLAGKNKNERILALWEEWNHKEIIAELDFDITPNMPTALWLRSSYQTMAGMFRQWYREWPRSALVTLEKTAACNHVMKRTFTRFIWYQPTWILKSADEIATKSNQSAWIYPGTLEDSWMYFRDPELDLRRYFNRNFQSSRNAIDNSLEEEYNAWLKRQLDFLRSENAVWCFIPTLYHGTSYASTAILESGWRDVNSHMFVCSGLSYTEDIWVDNYNFRDGLLKGDISKSLVWITRDYGGIWRYQSASSTSIISGLSDLHEYILIEVRLSNWSYVQLDIGAELSIVNIENIDVSDIIAFRLGWNVLLDWFQGDDKVIEQRLNLDIFVYASQKFNIFYPTSILKASNELLDALPEWILWKYVSQIQKHRFFDVNSEESKTLNILDVYRDELALEVFWTSYNWLSDEESLRVQRLYRAHSLWLQILWYHTFGGAEWTPGSSNINAWVPLLAIFTDEDIENIEQLYRSYISDKKQEYYTALKKRCSEESFQVFPFIQVRFFPGDTTSNLFYQISIQLEPDSLRTLNDFNVIEKEKFLRTLLGDQIAGGNIPSWESILISKSDVQLALQVFSLPGDEHITLRTQNGKVSMDHDLINATSSNPTMRAIMAGILANESYISPCEECNPWYETFVWPFLDSKRRFLKSTLHDLDLAGYTDTINTSFEEWNIPKPRSVWDFQLRFDNLYTSEYKSSWPWVFLGNIIADIQDPNGKHGSRISELQELYPDILADDFKLLQEIQVLLDDSKNLSSGTEVAEILYRLLRFNDGSHSNIIWKIVSLELSKHKIEDNFNHVAYQFQLSGWDMRDIDEDMIERLRNSVWLAFNKWEGTQLMMNGQNYIYRIFDALDAKYPWVRSTSLPEARRTDDILNNVVFKRNIFLEDTETFLAALSEYPENEETLLIKSFLESFLKIDINIPKSIFALTLSSEIDALLREEGFDTSILPTMDEYNGVKNGWRRQIYWYVNNKEELQSRIQQPETSLLSYLPAPTATFLLIVHMLCKNLQSYFDASLNRKLWRYRRRKYYKPDTYTYIEYIFQKLGIKVNLEREDSYRNIKREKERQQTQQIRVENRVKSLIRNRFKNKKDWKDTILWMLRKWIHLINSLTLRWFQAKKLIKNEIDISIDKISNNEIDDYTARIIDQNTEDLVLTNQHWHPESENYSDGQYSINGDVWLLGDIYYHPIYNPRPVSFEEYNDISKNADEKVTEVTLSKVLYIIWWIEFHRGEITSSPTKLRNNEFYITWDNSISQAKNAVEMQKILPVLSFQRIMNVLENDSKQKLQEPFSIAAE